MTTAQPLILPAKIPAADTVSKRLVCVDVFRGLAVAGMIFVDNPGSDDGAYWPIKHAQWNGWTAADLIFPFFLFLVGVSMVYSFSARLRRGKSRRQILFHCFKRSLILIAIGLWINAFPFVRVTLSTWRIEGVTQRIAVCYFASAVLALWANRRGQIVAIAACLLGYWALLRFMPVPGLGLPARDIPFMDPARNIVAWFDRLLFSGRLYNGDRDPEGIISNIPAIATTLIGVITGGWLRSENNRSTIASRMLLAGTVSMAAGIAWDRWFPINKNLWTSSFVLLTAGFALILLSLLYWMLEIKQWRGAWTMPFLVFGMNAIVGFFADSFVYGPGYSFTIKGQDGSTLNWHEAAQARLVALGASTPNASLIYSAGALFFCWTLLWLFWRKRIFIKI